MNLQTILNENQQFFTDRDKIEQWLQTQDIVRYVINDDFTVDVNGGVDLSYKSFEQLPVKFNKVSGNFTVSDGLLTTLAGCPQFVGRNFNCSHSKITSLEGGPQVVDGIYNCNSTPLETLKGSPTSAHEFFCGGTKLTSLEFAPKQLGVLSVSKTEIKSYRNVHKHVRCNRVVLQQNPPIPGTICWILVPGIREIDLIGANFTVTDIYNKHIRTKDILACQEDLIDAGFPEWAKL